MSLFSYAVTRDGIALYPNQDQYQLFYNSDFPSSLYPNEYNPGYNDCNTTDILGQPGVCGVAGPKSPLPFWSASSNSTNHNAFFKIGTGSDTRVGGCFNLVGESENRVLPCYCYFNSAKMNRTTSCDWINDKWFETDIGKVIAVITRLFCVFSLTIASEGLLGPKFQ
jgi:hypothetical protein